MKQKKLHKKPVKTSSSATGTYLLYGRHAVLAALGNPKRQCLRGWMTSQANQEIRQLFPELSLATTPCEHHDISQKLQEGAVHQGFLLEVKPLSPPALENLEAARRILLLDQVTDPHNVGAILRSAAAFDVDAIIVPRHNAPSETGVMAKSASGALEVVPLLTVTNLKDAIKTLKQQGFWVLGMDGGGDTSLPQAPHYDKTALVMGAEGKGLRPLVRNHCDIIVSLPISPKVESLNVSNAAAIALYSLSHNG